MATGNSQAREMPVDRRFVFWLGGAVLVLIAAVSLFAPAVDRNDPRPSTYNAAPGGAKAALLLLKALGRPADPWDEALDELASVDAPHTTIVLAEPLYSALEKDRLAAALKAFLERGGRALVTGAGGALLLPGGSVQGSRRLQALCYTDPEGPGVLARAGHVEMQDVAGWSAEGPEVLVEQRCGPDAVVVRMPVGQGEAVWWSSASPLTNAELHHDADLKLLLASLGDGRRVLFDEALHQTVRSSWSATQGLPLWWMLGQAGLLFGAVVFSFSRRSGPIRLPVGLPRSSPVEFAVSMGDLYGKAGATGAATEAARRRVEKVLVSVGGLSAALVQKQPEEIAAALQARFGGSWDGVVDHLREARDVAEARLRPSGALRLVRAMEEDIRRIRHAAQPASARLEAEERAEWETEAGLRPRGRQGFPAAPQRAGDA